MIIDYMVKRFVFASALCGLLLAGCGGSGSSEVQTTPMSLTINWPDRGRAVSPPSSALSARVVVRAAGAGGANVEFVANRNENALAHTETYTSAQQGTAGTRTVETRFYGGRDGAGSLVGEATFSSQIGTNGQIQTNVSVDSRIHEVMVAADQRVLYKRSKNLVATAFDAEHHAVVVQPDAFVWAVASGGSNLRFEDGEAEGVLVGGATVTASLDGVTSTATEVAVVPNAEYIALEGANLFAISRDGQSLVGTMQNQQGIAYIPMRWTKSGGIQTFEYTPAANAYVAAYGTNQDGTSFSGTEIVDGRIRGWTSTGGSLSFVDTPNTVQMFVGRMSANGVAIGYQTLEGISRAFTMHPGQAPMLLALMPNATQSRAASISDDGTRVVGSMLVSGQWRAVLWADGVPQLVPTGEGNSGANVVSGDGLVVFGFFGDGPNPTGHYRWSAADGLQPLAFPLTNNIGGASRTGDLAVNDQHIWSATNGVEATPAYVARTYGLSMTANQLQAAAGFSSDGRTMFGHQGWIIRPLPEE